MSDAQNQPKPIPPASEIETYRPKPVLPAEPSQELLSVLAQALQAQVNAGDYSSIDKIIELQAKSNENDQAFRNQEIQLKQQAIAQGYTITKMRETRLDNETKANKEYQPPRYGRNHFCFCWLIGLSLLAQGHQFGRQDFYRGNGDSRWCGWFGAESEKRQGVDPEKHGARIFPGRKEPSR
jgi:hypothetical protein